MGSEPNARVEIRFPGSAGFLRLARLTSADAGSRAGLDVDAIEDLRIAVSELCALVGGDGAEITLVFTNEPGAVRVDGSGGPGSLSGENAEMAKALVEAVVDEYEFLPGAERSTFTIVKRHA